LQEAESKILRTYSNYLQNAAQSVNLSNFITFAISYINHHRNSTFAYDYDNYEEVQVVTWKLYSESLLNLRADFLEEFLNPDDAMNPQAKQIVSSYMEKPEVRKKEARGTNRMPKWYRISQLTHPKPGRIQPTTKKRGAPVESKYMANRNNHNGVQTSALALLIRVPTVLHDPEPDGMHLPIQHHYLNPLTVMSVFCEHNGIITPGWDEVEDTLKEDANLVHFPSKFKGFFPYPAGADWHPHTNFYSTVFNRDVRLLYHGLWKALEEKELNQTNIHWKLGQALLEQWVQIAVMDAVNWFGIQIPVPSWWKDYPNLLHLVTPVVGATLDADTNLCGFMVLILLAVGKGIKRDLEVLIVPGLDEKDQINLGENEPALLLEDDFYGCLYDENCFVTDRNENHKNVTKGCRRGRLDQLMPLFNFRFDNVEGDPMNLKMLLMEILTKEDSEDHRMFLENLNTHIGNITARKEEFPQWLKWSEGADPWLGDLLVGKTASTQKTRSHEWMTDDHILIAMNYTKRTKPKSVEHTQSAKSSKKRKGGSTGGSKAKKNSSDEDASDVPAATSTPASPHRRSSRLATPTPLSYAEDLKVDEEFLEPLEAETVVEGDTESESYVQVEILDDEEKIKEKNESGKLVVTGEEEFGEGDTFEDTKKKSIEGTSEEDANLEKSSTPKDLYSPEDDIPLAELMRKQKAIEEATLADILIEIQEKQELEKIDKANEAVWAVLTSPGGLVDNLEDPKGPIVTAKPKTLFPEPAAASVDPLQFAALAVARRKAQEETIAHEKSSDTVVAPSLTIGRTIQRASTIIPANLGYSTQESPTSYSKPRSKEKQKPAASISATAGVTLKKPPKQKEELRELKGLPGKPVFIPKEVYVRDRHLIRAWTREATERDPGWCARRKGPMDRLQQTVMIPGEDFHVENNKEWWTRYGYTLPMCESHGMKDTNCLRKVTKSMEKKMMKSMFHKIALHTTSAASIYHDYLAMVKHKVHPMWWNRKEMEALSPWVIGGFHGTPREDHPDIGIYNPQGSPPTPWTMAGAALAEKLISEDMDQYFHPLTLGGNIELACPTIQDLKPFAGITSKDWPTPEYFRKYGCTGVGNGTVKEVGPLDDAPPDTRDEGKHGARDGGSDEDASSTDSEDKKPKATEGHSKDDEGDGKSKELVVVNHTHEEEQGDGIDTNQGNDDSGSEPPTDKEDGTVDEDSSGEKEKTKEAKSKDHIPNKKSLKVVLEQPSEKGKDQGDGVGIDEDNEDNGSETKTEDEDDAEDADDSAKPSEKDDDNGDGDENMEEDKAPGNDDTGDGDGGTDEAGSGMPPQKDGNTGAGGGKGDADDSGTSNKKSGEAGGGDQQNKEDGAQKSPATAPDKAVEDAEQFGDPLPKSDTSGEQPSPRNFPKMQEEVAKLRAKPKNMETVTMEDSDDEFFFNHICQPSPTVSSCDENDSINEEYLRQLQRRSDRIWKVKYTRDKLSGIQPSVIDQVRFLKVRQRDRIDRKEKEEEELQKKATGNLVIPKNQKVKTTSEQLERKQQGNNGDMQTVQEIPNGTPQIRNQKKRPPGGNIVTEQKTKIPKRHMEYLDNSSPMYTPTVDDAKFSPSKTDYPSAIKPKKLFQNSKGTTKKRMNNRLTKKNLSRHTEVEQNQWTQSKKGTDVQPPTTRASREEHFNDEY
jgi:hypothetical protein